MRCFDLYLNGRKVARAGVGDSGVVTASFSLISVRSNEATLHAEDEDDSQAFLVGMESPAVGVADGKRLKWMDQPIQVGDEFRLVVLESDTRDEPPQTEEMNEALATTFVQGAQHYLRAIIPVVGYVLHTDSRFASLGPGGSIEQLRDAVALGSVPLGLRNEVVAWALGKLVEAGIAEAVGENHVRLAPKAPT